MRPSFPWQRVHCTGVGGVGMSGLAHILLDRDVTVTGTDTEDNPGVRALWVRGADVRCGHYPGLVRGADLLIRSSAVPETDPEVCAARESGIPVWRRGEFLACLAACFPRVIAVAGSHGKTTTTAMLAHIFRAAGWEPGCLVGGDLRNGAPAAAAGAGRLLITEVDESDGTQACMRCACGLVINVEDDHCWSLGGVAGLERCFTAFADRAETLVAWATPATQRLFGQHHAVCFAAAASLPAGLDLAVPGVHNRINAGLAYLTALRFGVAPDRALAAVNAFPGVDRRLTERWRAPDHAVVLVEDYAHHPTEVRAALETLRQTYPRHRLSAVFQPHRHERVKRYAAEFGVALSTADEVVVTAPFAAWLDDSEGADPRRIVEGIRHGRARFDPSPFPELAARLVSESRGNLILAVLGAGDIAALIPLLEQRLSARVLEGWRSELGEAVSGLAMSGARPWSELTTLGVGAACPLVLEPANAAELGALLRRHAAGSVAPLVLGAGSNFVGTDEQTPRLVLRLCRGEFRRLQPGPDAGRSLEVGAGVGLNRLVRHLAKRGRIARAATALAWIPGTVGGAVTMNAGADGVTVAEIVEAVEGVCPPDTVLRLHGSDVAWGYRNTDLPPDFIVTRVWFRLAQSDPQECQARLAEFGRARRAREPRRASAGSVFRNPAPATAGQLIEQAGCKGLRCGGCRVSPRHANHIVARAGAAERYVVDLMRRVRRQVARHCGVWLEPEVRFVNPASAALVTERPAGP